MSVEMTPVEVVRELDKYIVGQPEAKRAVAVAVRNRWRRLQLPKEVGADILPKNIIMIGPTGVGKTEIARRLAQLVRAPFVKVEASRYTEVGYVGRDVETMVRDLTEVAVNMVKQRRMEQVRTQAEAHAEDRLLDVLIPHTTAPADAEAEQQRANSRDRMRKMLRAGVLEDREVEVTVEEKAMVMQAFVPGQEEMGMDFQSMMEHLLPSRSRTRRMKVREAREVMIQQEGEKLIDRDALIEEALDATQNSGIIFIDEIDKVAGRETGHGPEVSREGVQRDLLPIVEGTAVKTRYGVVRTDHVLFIASGAFHVSKPSDLIPELQGRFPIRVELKDLTKADFIRILTEPKNALTAQYKALLSTEGVTISFDAASIEELADIASQVNSRSQNIGARRLQTVMERLLEDISFHAPNMSGQTISIDTNYVRQRLADIIKDQDLTKYIL